MKFTLLATLILPAMFYFGTRWGTTGVALAWIIGFPVVALPLFRLVFRVIEVRLSDYLRALEPALLGTAVMAAAVLGVRWLTSTSPGGVTLAVECITGALAYVAVIRIFYWERLRGIMTVMRRRDA